MIVAVDFDGVLCEDVFPDIGDANRAIVSIVGEMIGAGMEVVLWTCRTGPRLEEAVEWCRERGLEFCSVNENAPSNRAKYEAEYPMGTRKVYADVYFDDRSHLDYMMGDSGVDHIKPMYFAMLKALREFESKEKK